MRILLSIIVGLACSLEFSAQAQNLSNPNNTVVRFRVSAGGKVIGDLDLELFAQDKPATVRSFLDYVVRGSYENAILHVLSPNSFLQGGAFRVQNPRDKARFISYVARPTFERIMSEFDTGPQLSNTFGTIAMIPESPETNAMSAEWFINLANNTPNFDSRRYVVFGQVIAGSDVLVYFNSLSRSNGIVRMSDFCDGHLDCLLNSPPFAALPVAYRGYRAPRIIDLHTVRAFVLPATDTIPPRVAITSPADKSRFTEDPMLTVTGTASDERGVHWVWYSHANALQTNAVGSNDWSAPITLGLGTNTFFVESVDTAGNRSKPALATFYYFPLLPLDLQVVGGGGITGASDGQLLEGGRGYSLTATPLRGNFFTGWTGSIFSASSKLSFVMESNMALTAVFMTNPFIALKGTYNGLFFELTNSVQHDRSGFFTARLRDSGAFSAKLTANGKTHSFSGMFNLNGRAANVINRPGMDPLTVLLALDVEGDSHSITGVVSTATWAANLEADLAEFNARTMPAPQAGKYTLVIPGSDADEALPGGDSFGTVSVATSGAVTFSGVLADSTKATQRAALSRNGRWPFYLSLYRGQGSALGWLTFTNRDEDDISGSVTWTKLPMAAKYYPEGFALMSEASGSVYQRPASPSEYVVSFTEGSLLFSGGSLTEPLVNEVTLMPGNKVADASGANKLKMTITSSSGLIKGSVMLPGATRATAFKGIIHQKGDYGAGCFLDADRSGRVFFGP